jgi:hypothetical protein
MNRPNPIVFVVSLAMSLSILTAAAGEAVASTEIVIAPASPGESRLLGDIAAANNIVVAWQQGHRSFIRWSTDNGSSFEPKYALRKGLRAKGPQVAACGDLLFAASTWTASGGSMLGVDYVDLTGSSPVTGRFYVEQGRGADIACIGDVVALTWQDDEGNVQLAVVDGKCANPCVPAYREDLGHGPGPSAVAAYDHGFVVVFPSDGFLVNTFDVARVGDAINVTAHPSTRILAGKDVYSPQVAADGSRVVIAYELHGQTLMAVSDDRGQSFINRIIVSKFCRDCPEAGSAPDSVDVEGQNILVEVRAGAGMCPGPICAWDQAYFTRTDGAKWKTYSGHADRLAESVLIDGAIAEAWDNFRAVRFQTTPLS